MTASPHPSGSSASEGFHALIRVAPGKRTAWVLAPVLLAGLAALPMADVAAEDPGFAEAPTSGRTPDPRNEYEGEAGRPPASGLTVEEGRAFWAYRPLANSQPPEVADAAWPAGAVDRFLLARMEAARMRPAPQAAPETRLRGLHLDLTGLPPEPDAIAAFLADPSDEAWLRHVDRLLASPRFGEHWGRHWLDVAPYGESYTLRGLILREAWRYRDYVIGAFNRDLPFDRFVREQIAGDLLPATGDLPERQGRVAATSQKLTYRFDGRDFRLTDVRGHVVRAVLS